jgi:hypothetical protein
MVNGYCEHDFLYDNNSAGLISLESNLADNIALAASSIKPESRFASYKIEIAEEEIEALQAVILIKKNTFQNN